MSILSKASIGVAVGLVLGLGAAWLFFVTPRQTTTSNDTRAASISVAQTSPPIEPATATDVRPAGESVAQTSPQAIEQKGTVAERPIEPSVPVANDEPASPEAVPLDLTNRYAMKASAFDTSTRYPWPAMPRGSQTFANVPLEIGGAIFLWGERNSKKGMEYPEHIKGIPLQRKFETLYICHAAFFEGPAGTAMCEVVFHFDDGTSASDTLVCGGDARDWFADRAAGTLGPSAPRSTLAWDGDGKMGERTQAIRCCLTAIANPHPDKAVTALDIVSAKTQTAACILAITTGKAGLMQRAEETPPGEARDP